MIKYLLHPFTIYLIFLLFSVALIYLKRQRLAKAVFILAFVWLFLTSLGFLPKLIVRSLESRYRVFNPAANDSTNYHILVLGGGHVEDAHLPANAQLNITALGRLVEGIRIYRLLPNSKLVLSGYSPNGQTTQAEILRRTAVLLGVDQDRILIQDKPKNTFEEAEEYSRKFGRQHQLVVVTSATHMPRAIKMFSHLGIKPIAAPTNFLIRSENYGGGDWLPGVKHMDDMHTATKEYIALWTSNWRN